jgi:hypothetical protein
VEAFVPTFLTRLRDDLYVDAEAVSVDRVRLDVARHDPVIQRLYESHVTITADGIRLNPIVTRYAWPRRNRSDGPPRRAAPARAWAAWEREPFTALARAHVSVYGR